MPKKGRVRRRNLSHLRPIPPPIPPPAVEPPDPVVAPIAEAAIVPVEDPAPIVPVEAPPVPYIFVPANFPLVPRVPCPLYNFQLSEEQQLVLDAHFRDWNNFRQYFVAPPNQGVTFIYPRVVAGIQRPGRIVTGAYPDPLVDHYFYTPQEDPDPDWV